ncbi:hypothetical protein UPYG_G00022820 [Umbra pygmaea]|uniref:Uncharacterized protein n=1 Tax=Umbra pygmaea TaxID=75934 RepID=A0ABD0XP88_UMBPY
MKNGSGILLVGAVMVLGTMWTDVDTAPTLLPGRGDMKPLDPAKGNSVVQDRTQASTTSTSNILSTVLMATKPARVKKSSTTTSSRSRLIQQDEVTSSPGRRAQILKMLSALEDLSRIMNSSISNRMTIMTRGSTNGRNSAKKNKAVAFEDTGKTTRAPPVEVRGNVTASRVNTDNVDPNTLSGRNIKKSIQPQSKKTGNKSVFLEVLLPKLILHCMKYT